MISNPKLKRSLQPEAAARGLSVDRYVASIVTDYSRDGSTDLSYSYGQPLTDSQLAANLEAGLADVAEGRTRAAEEVFAELHRQYGIHG